MKNVFTTLIVLCFAALAGCATVTRPDGSTAKKFLGLPVPFSGSAAPVEASPETAAIIKMMAPFSYFSLLLIVGGAALWWFTKGTTGAGRFFVGLGVGLLILAVTAVKYAWLVGIIAIIAGVALAGWLIYDFIIKN